MPRLQILSREEINNFSSPPRFNNSERELYFSIDPEMDKFLDQIESPTSKVGFNLLYGYFKASDKFITSDQFFGEDVNYVCDLMGIKKEDLNFNKYMANSFWRHKKIVVQMCGYHAFDDAKKKLLESEIDFFISNQDRPRQVLTKTLEFLKSYKIETPNYNTLSSIIISRFNSYDDSLQLRVQDLLDPDITDRLEDLIKVSPRISGGG